MTAKEKENNNLIKSYKTAYFLANAKEFKGEILFVSGFFRFEKEAVRRGKFISMIATLLDRAYRLPSISTHIERLCKETARNVRHKAIDIAKEHYRAHGDNDSAVVITSDLERDLMNIQFDDVNPLK